MIKPLLLHWPGDAYTPEGKALEQIGRYFACKYAARAGKSDVQTAARQLKKQGVDIRVAVALLARQQKGMHDKR